jgi:hypothetical protein
MVYIERMEGVRSKEEFYLAQIAAEIRRTREMFAKTPKQVSIDDYLLNFTNDTVVATRSRQEAAEPVKKIVPGAEAMKDLHWARVNANAMRGWAARFGKRNLKDGTS